MKKIISFFAASALALGLIGCSGDLHENDILPLALVGMTADAGNHVIPMTLDKPDGSEQSLKITLKDGFELTGANGTKYQIKDDPKDSWRAAGESITSLHFKVIPGVNVKADGTPDWTMDFASLNKEDPQYITAGEDYQKVGKRGDANVSGDPKHLIFDGCIAGETYVLRAKYNAAAGTLSLKLDGEKNDPAGVKFVFAATNYKTFPAKDKDDKDLSYSMSKAGSTYTYQFIAKEDETLSFHLTNAMAGTLGGTLSTTASDLAVNETTPTDMSLTVKKNAEYKITMDVSKGIAKATIKYEVVDILKDAKVNGTFKYAENSYSDDTTKCESGSLIFKAERSEITFYVERAAGGVFAKDSVSTIKPGDSAVSMKYVTDTKDEFGEVTKTAVENATPLKIAGLTVGSYYQIDFAKDNSTASLEASVKLLPPVDVTGMYIMIWFNTADGWSNSKFEPLVKDDTYAWHVEVTPDPEKSVDEVRFDLCKANADGGQDWSRRYGIKTSGGTITLGEKAGPFIPSEPDKRDYFEGKQKTYRFDFNGEGGLWVTVTEK